MSLLAAISGLSNSSFKLSSTLIAFTGVALVGYAISLAVYRLYFHPLAKYPGPRLAALTRWYECYQEIFLRGQFLYSVERMHEKYGPIVRITPDELHIRDPEEWETLFVKHNKARRYEWLESRFGNKDQIFSTCDPDLHRIRRAPLAPMFSRRSVVAIEGLVHDKVSLLLDRLQIYQDTGKPVDMVQAYSAFAGDVVTQYAFGQSQDWLKTPDFKGSLHAAFMAGSEFSHVSLQFPWIHPFLNMLPDSLNERMNPALSQLLVLQRDLVGLIARITKEVREQSKPSDEVTIFHSVLQSDLPDIEKRPERLSEEAQLVIGAGIETTSWALCNATYYILENPMILKRLQDELDAAIPNPNAADAFNYLKLESLPYLRGCVREGIRLSLGLTGRNARVMTEPYHYKNWVIPARTPISMSVSDVHLNEYCFPEAAKFKPERWADGALSKAPDGQPLERYFVAFGKGSRMCLGYNLAFMETFIVIATIFRRNSFELFETTRDDIEMHHDFFLPHPKLGSKGVRVKFLGNRD